MFQRSSSLSRLLVLSLILSLCSPLRWTMTAVAVSPVNSEVNSQTIPDPFSLSSYSAVLMEQSTGQILYEKNSSTPMAPASVTKIMTILLVMEALEDEKVSREEQVIVSANAASMGGSQVYLKEGEVMSLWELLKCVVVVSGNDASVALAEHLSGSESAFVQKMNEKAQSLGMSNTLFFNCTGLPQEGHSTTAFDIALMSQALMENHPEIQELTTIWMDSIREESFGLSNTNRLIHDYTGATGLKTGYTDTALYCMSATASRDGLDLIAVVLKSPSSAERFDDTKAMFDYGFANYVLEDVYLSTALPPIPIILGEKDYIQPFTQQPVTMLVRRSEKDLISTASKVPDILEAPVMEGDVFGTFDIYIDGKLKETHPVYATETIEKLSLFGIYQALLAKAFMG